MAGLLDYQIDPVSQGLLGFSQGMLTPRAQGGGVGAALGGFNQGALQAGQIQRQMAMQAMQQRLLQSNIDENAAQSEQRKAMAEALRQKAAQDAARKAQQDDFWGSLTGGNQAVIAQTGGVAPTNANAALLNQPFQLTPQIVAMAVRAGIDPDMLKKVAESKNWGREEVARVLETADAQGRPQQQQFDKFGNPMGGAMPKPYERKMQDLGGTVGVFDPYTAQQSGSLGKTMTPGEVASNAVARGNLGLSQQRFAFDKAQAGNTADKWVNDLERGVQVNMANGESRPITTGGAPIGPRGQTSTTQRVTDANDSLDLIKQAEALIDRSTGSYIGRGLDIAAQAFGGATDGAKAAAQLRALEGALISKMPKMSGPQSDKDVLLYKQMAGQIGDATIPASIKKAALETIKEIQQRYAGTTAGPSAPGGMDLQEMARRELARRQGQRGGASGSF